jgi:hypothetical protein
MKHWAASVIAILLAGFPGVASAQANCEALRLRRGPIEPSTAKLVDWHEPFVPLRRKVLDLVEIQDRRFTLADDCCPLAFLG